MINHIYVYHSPTFEWCSPVNPDMEVPAGAGAGASAGADQDRDRDRDRYPILPLDNHC